MDFSSKPKESAEAHNERLPPHGIDMRPGGMISSGQQRLFDVELHDVNLERIRRDVFSERPYIVNNGFHLDRALQHARRSDGFRGYRGQTRQTELVRFIAVAPAQFLLRYRVSPSCHRESIDLRDQVRRGKIDDAFARSEQICRRLTHLAESEHAAPPKPPRRRHWREVGRTIFISAAD